MRLSLSTLICMLVSIQLLWAIPGKGQTLDEKKVTMEASNATLEKALSQLEKLSGFRIAYASEKVSRYGRVSLDFATRSVSATLKALLSQTDLGFRLTDNTIMIVSRHEQPAPEKLPAAAADSTVVIKGKVTDESGAPMPGVSVRIQNTTKGVFTDVDGNFTIVGNRGQVIVFSSIGSAPQEHVIAKAGTISIVLKTDSRKLDDIVVVGYGTQRKANLTGAVSTVDIKKTLDARPISDIGRGLQGTVPGLTITSASGDLGRNPSIRLRGMTGSLNTGAAGAQPLILVDNVEIPSLQMVNPQDIESISVLKDAASTSIYGTRAAWGVILITTKSGRKGAPASINYSNNFSWSKYTSMPKIAGAVDGAEAMLAAKLRSTPSEPFHTTLGMSFDRVGIEKMKKWQADYGHLNLPDSMVMGRDFEIRDGKLYFYRPWDVGKRYMKDVTFMQKHDLSVSGGGEKTNYHLSLGYLNQGGILRFKTDKFDRYNVNLSVNSAVTDWIDVRGKMMLSQSVFETPHSFSGSQLGPWYYLYRWPIIYPYGTYQGKPFRSAMTETQQASMDQTKSTFARVQVGTTLKPFKDFTVDVDYTYSNTNTHLHSPGGGTAGIDFWNAPTQLNYMQNYQAASWDAVRYVSSWNEWNTGRAFATYNFGFGDHTFKAIAGMDVDLYKNWSQTSERRGLIDPVYPEIPLASGDQFVNGDRGHWATNGYFARVNYDYKNKFLLELNGRYDGSSKFPRNQLYDFFPSVSAGYILTEDTYLDFAKPVLSFLKLRGSYGSVGNQNVGPNRFISVMNPFNSGWLIGTSNQVSFSTPEHVSKSLTWETVSTLDFGVDARFFNNKFGITFDWYNRSTTNMISGGLTLPSTYGGTVPVMNFGAMRTRGWELALDFSHTFENGLRITGMATLSDFNEKITKLANATRTVTANYEGKTIGEIWGYQTDRLFQESDFTKNPQGKWILKPGITPQNILEGNTAWFYYSPGDVKYVNRNGDSTLSQGANTVDDPGDQFVIGNSTPRYQYGVRLGADWKGIDFSIFIQGVGKRELWPSGPLFVPGFGGDSWYAHHLDYWTPTNTDAFYPAATFHDGSNNSRNFYRQTRYLLNMAYTRVKNISLGYTLPANIASRAKLKTARIYVSAENLFTFDKLKIPIDPEIDYTTEQTDASAFGRTYPFRKEISVGLQLTF
ncbi:TonB-dependent receptor [Chitinophaga lutea]|nr:TonB-dependent receptor [Chitinophaga lutea]